MVRKMYICQTFGDSTHICLLHRRAAQMAESVDALVSNTSGAIHPGSIPGLGTVMHCSALCYSAYFFR